MKPRAGELLMTIEMVLSGPGASCWIGLLREDGTEPSGAGYHRVETSYAASGQLIYPMATGDWGTITTLAVYASPDPAAVAIEKHQVHLHSVQRVYRDVQVNLCLDWKWESA